MPITGETKAQIDIFRCFILCNEQSKKQIDTKYSIYHDIKHEILKFQKLEPDIFAWKMTEIIIKIATDSVS